MRDTGDGLDTAEQKRLLGSRCCFRDARVGAGKRADARTGAAVGFCYSAR